jgi:hypothetical protein
LDQLPLGAAFDLFGDYLGALLLFALLPVRPSWPCRCPASGQGRQPPRAGAVHQSGRRGGIEGVELRTPRRLCGCGVGIWRLLVSGGLGFNLIPHCRP